MRALCGFLLLCAGASLLWAGEGPRISGLVLDPVMQDLGEIEEGRQVMAAVLIRNHTEETMQIVSVEASCGCTRAVPDRYVLAPGEFTMLNIEVDTTGKTGRVKKSVVVTDQAGRRSTAWLRMTVRPSAHGREMARHTIFDGACARCHAEPARGLRNGRAIYQAVCAMCHGVDARGDYAPDLRHIRDADVLRATIREGADPRHMPGFARENGGPLTDAQISSLVKWLLSLDGMAMSGYKSHPWKK